MTQQSNDTDDLTVVGLTSSFEAFGLVMDYLSRVAPFAGFELGKFGGIIRQQLGSGRGGFIGKLHASAGGQARTQSGVCGNFGTITCR